MQGVIQKVMPSKSGKSLSVYIGDKRFQAKTGSGLQNAVGQTITFDPEPQPLDDGGTLYWINKFQVSGGSPVAVNGGGMAASPGHAQQAPASSYQPLVSNLAAHLIGNGGSTKDLAVWFAACKALLEGKPVTLRDDDPVPTDADPEFNDKIPF